MRCVHVSSYSTPRILTHRNSRRPYKDATFYLYSLYGWGVPIAIVTVGQVLEKSGEAIVKPNFGAIKCWFTCKCSLVSDVIARDDQLLNT